MKTTKKEQEKKKKGLIIGIIVAIPLLIIALILITTLISNGEWARTFDWAASNELVMSKKNRTNVTVDLSAFGGCTFHGLTDEDKEVRGCSWTKHDAKYGDSPSIKMTIDFGSTKQTVILKRYYDELQQMGTL